VIQNLTQHKSFIIDSVFSSPSPSAQGNVRLLPFNHYWDLFCDNILGVGVNYFPKLAFVNPFNHESMLTESFLDTFIHGGIFLVFFLAYFSYRIMCVNYKNYSDPKSFLIFLSLKSVFVGNLVLAFIGGYPIYQLRTWIIAAMILSFEH
jgi:hypothetical protein